MGILTAQETVALEARCAIEGMKAADPFSPPDLPGTARVEILTADDRIEPWQFADAVRWWEARAYRITEPGADMERCDCCGEYTVSSEFRSVHLLDICESCFDHGEY